LKLIQLVHDTTNIRPTALSGASLDKFNVDQRLSWAAERQTTREEHKVYALLVVFEARTQDRMDKAETLGVHILIIQHLATTDWTPSTLQGWRKLGVLQVLSADVGQLRFF
jgi:hypothetical protein